MSQGKQTLIDVRSPGEFAQGHIPNAINVPLLSDEARHHVGLTYKTQGSSEAVQLGLEYVAAQIDELVERLTSVNGQITLYCQRGGQRSHAVATLMRSIGIPPSVLPGGYKQFRQLVLAKLAELSHTPLIVLQGRTGSGKTALLQHFLERTIDFEAMANHRGSAFGDFGLSPAKVTQQQYENLIATRFSAISARPILCEIEGFVGPVRVPKAVRENILRSPMILIERPLEVRAEHIVREYCGEWSSAKEQLFCARLELLAKYLSGAQKAEIIDAVKNLRLNAAARMLLQWHYDPMYDRHIRKHASQFIGTVEFGAETSQAINDLERYIR